MNTLDPTHNRGKVKIINSFTTTQERMETMTKPSKGGKVKSSQARIQAHPSTSTQGNTGRPQVRCTTISGKIVMRMCSAQNAELGPMLQKCAMYPPKQA